MTDVASLPLPRHPRPLVEALSPALHYDDAAYRSRLPLTVTSSGFGATHLRFGPVHVQLDPARPELGFVEWEATVGSVAAAVALGLLEPSE